MHDYHESKVRGNSNCKCLRIIEMHDYHESKMVLTINDNHEFKDENVLKIDYNNYPYISGLPCVGAGALKARGP